MSCCELLACWDGVQRYLWCLETILRDWTRSEVVIEVEVSSVEQPQERNKYTGQHDEEDRNIQSRTRNTPSWYLSGKVGTNSNTGEST